MDRQELAASLRVWRARLQPSDVGLPTSLRRRTPGLRREEVALLAGISVDYLTRLEQRRGPHPSDAVLASLARALRLTDHERDQLFRLAGSAPPAAGRIASSVKPSVQRLLDRLSDLPAMLLNAKTDVLAWNELAAALLGDFAAWPPAQRNIAWQRFLGGPTRVVGTPEEQEQMGARMVSALHSASARYPTDPDLRRLIDELREHSGEFERIWQERPSVVWDGARKRIDHPQLGLLELDCDVLAVAEADQQMIVYSAAPGTREAEALALLRVVGVQDLSPHAR
ncbi:MAG: helix-turn-helix domain-containing protein [Propionibacteriales bacterium]|nr:helix-turn-helix domain-containing protein [Propionibacteriales bacterium]